MCANSIKKLKHIVFVAFHECQILDVTGPMQVFSSANEAQENPTYKLTLASPDGLSTVATCGLTMATTPLSDIKADTIDTLIIAGGTGTQQAIRNTHFIRWVQQAFVSTRRICSVCSGTFILAAAGLTRNKKVTTHWHKASLLQKLYPDTIVEADALYITDGTLWSSAGVTAGIDMSLALVEEDHTRQLAMTIAKHLVVYARRPGNQSQFSTLLEGQTNASNTFTKLLNWLPHNITLPITVEKMASYCSMSNRSFHRKFTKEVGTTPAKYLERLRLDTARTLLEGPKAPIKVIATKAGFKTPLRLIQAFERQLGMSPSTYRHLHSQK